MLRQRLLRDRTSFDGAEQGCPGLLGAIRRFRFWTSLIRFHDERRLRHSARMALALELGLTAQPQQIISRSTDLAV